MPMRWVNYTNMPNRQGAPATELSTQEILNKSFDRLFEVLAFELLGRNGNTVQTIGTDLRGALDVQGAFQFNEDSGDSNLLYIGEAEIGAATSSASWRIYRIDLTSGINIKYADGDEQFNNIYDNRESLTYV